MSKYRVWIDQDLCTGDGICGEIAPDIFGGGDDGLFYVKEAGWDSIFKAGTKDPVLEGADGTASVPDGLLGAVIESAEECPGECIFIEPATV